MAGRDRNFHEQLTREEAVKGSSDRTFGLTFAAVFALIGTLKLWSGAASAPYWLVAAAVFIAPALLAPGMLAPLNRLWLKIGLLLYRVVNPAVMALLFFLVVTPMGLIMRLMGKRPLRLAADGTAPSYWIAREPPGPSPATMKRQF